nr:MAG TPA: hypothetical protein [Caudoviricetes sp.]
MCLMKSLANGLATVTYLKEQLQKRWLVNKDWCLNIR